MPESNMSMVASEIDKAVVIGTLETADISDADYISFYDTSENVGQKQKKISFGDIKRAITGSAPQLPTSTARDFGKAVVANGEGGYMIGSAVSPQIESKIINVSDWEAVSGKEPFTFSATKTLSTALGIDSLIELVVDDPTPFARYGLSAAKPTGQNIPFLAMEKPLEAMIVRLRIYA